ncbi:polynucleotide adenylyltransferase PcnB [Pseudohongiella sp.]|nr:polynucleotide adenylyltransferase PcnB [Pseudohongiella sp.]HEA63887.1 polynucleotide adenylyltransferase PcnB [Pseudohongiella sp.]
MNLDIDVNKVTVVPREKHNISRKDISASALKVLYRLNDAGFQAFLVGGGVRDLLLDGHPKDFDISTNATPEEVRDLFRNSRVIGRRFKIVHVRYGREIIEVTTFRAHHEIETEVTEGESRKHIKHLDSAHSSTGMILRDNVYGNIAEDAVRRDFTVNALYYTTNQFMILDFVNGLPDIEQRLIRMIGDPETRYREDPVRILRAIRLAAKLDFGIEQHTEEPIPRLATLLESISSARLFDETVKLFTNGSAEKTFALLRQYKVADYLFRPTLECLQDDDNDIDSKLLTLALRNTDNRLADGKSVTPAFLYAALLWPPLQDAIRQDCGNKVPTLGVLQECAGDVIVEQLKYTAIPKRFTAMMREIWELQLRLSPRNRRSVEIAFTHPRFRAAYDFLLLREAAGEQLNGLGDWWTRFQQVDSDAQNAMIDALQGPKTPRKRRRKPRKPESTD